MGALTIVQPLEARSVWVRELVRDDARGFARYMTRPEYQEHLAVRYPNPYAIRQFVSRAVARQDRDGRNLFHLAAQDKHSGKVVGDGFIQFHEHGVAELGWGVDPAKWGKGTGTDIARALVAIAIEHLSAHDVWCKVMIGNDASMTVATRAGLGKDRVISATARPAGRHRDIVIYRLKSNDYFELSY